MIKIKFKNIIFFIKKIIITFFSLILIYSAIITIHDFIDPKTTVKHLFFNYKYIVSSGSMEPTIKEGDGVFVFKINDCRDLKPSLKPHILEGEFDKNNDNGDIIVFQNKYNPEEIIIHRVVKNDKEKKKITTLGDRNGGYNDSDKDIDYDRVIGKYIFKFNRNYLIISIFLILIILFFIPDIFKKFMLYEKNKK